MDADSGWVRPGGRSEGRRLQRGVGNGGVDDALWYLDSTCKGDDDGGNGCESFQIFHVNNLVNGESAVCSLQSAGCWLLVVGGLCSM